MSSPITPPRRRPFLAVAFLAAVFASAGPGGARAQFEALYWFGNEYKMGLVHPAIPNNYSVFWMRCHRPNEPSNPGERLSAYLDLGWDQPFEVQQIDVFIDGRGHTYPVSGSINEMGDFFQLTIEIERAGDFLAELMEGQTLSLTAGGKDFSVRLQGAETYAQTLIRNCHE